MTADTIAGLLANDDLDAGVATAASAVKTRPQDPKARMVLAELCVLTGDLERAETHAKLAARAAPDDAVGLGVFRQHLRGLHSRDQWWQDGAVPAFPMGMTPCDELALKLNVAMRAGDGETAQAALEALDAMRLMEGVFWNDAPVGDLRDLDDRLPHAFEAVTAGGNYLWLDFARVREIEFQPTTRPLDLVCRRARVTLIDEAAADLLILAIYPGADGTEHQLARRTDFTDHKVGLTLAQGQRSYLAGEDVLSLLDAETIRFERGSDD